jgi:hypothetical protein
MQENSNESASDDTDTLFMLSGVALIVFGSELVRVIERANSRTVTERCQSRRGGDFDGFDCECWRQYSLCD